MRFLDRRDLAASGPRWARMTLRIEPGLVCIENYPEIRPGSESAKNADLASVCNHIFHYALGEHAVVKYRLKPLVRDAPLMSKTLTEIGTARASSFADGREATKCVADLVGEKDVAFALQIQVRPVSGDRSERVYRDGASTWSEPYLTVGKLVFPQQTLNEAGVNTELQSELCSHFKVDAASKEAKAMHKSFFFHPISTAKVHRPVGDINEYRCEYYARHAHARLAHMQEGTGVADHATFPFDEIKSNVSAFKREQP